MLHKFERAINEVWAGGTRPLIYVNRYRQCLYLNRLPLIHISSSAPEQHTVKWAEHTFEGTGIGRIEVQAMIVSYSKETSDGVQWSI